MGVKTLTEWQTDIRNSLGRSAADLNEIKGWVNDALLELIGAFKFPELQATGTIDTVAGTDSYALPADFRAFDDQGVSIISPQSRFGGILEVETRVEYKRERQFATTYTRGIPEAIHKYGGKMWIRPTPDATVTRIEFDYHKKLTKLANPSDVSPLQDEWDECIFRGALYRGHLRYGEHDRVINVYNLFLGLVRSRVQIEDLEEFPEGGISALQSRYDNLVR
jgi:hypothetical protein